MLPLKNDRFLKALWRQPVDYTPVWIMRQAGRYLPEYRKTREAAGSFMTLCKTPELACEVTLQPLRRYALDASIVFSDILTIPDAMGLGLQFIEGQGPIFERYLKTARDIDRVTVPDLARLSYVYDAIRLIQQELAGKVPLIGFCGSPWTLAAYMVDGQSKLGFPSLRLMKEREPALLHHLLDILAKSVAAHLNAQIEAGVQVVMIFDTWGGLLNAEDYAIFSLEYVKRIREALHSTYQGVAIPLILFTKGGSRYLSSMADLGVTALGVDWEISLAEARRQVGDRVALQGNVNPSVLLSAENEIREAVRETLASYGKGPGHVFNLGHGITPEVPPEHLGILIEAVHELSVAYHQ